MGQERPPPVVQPRLTPVASRTPSNSRIPIPEPKVENELERAMATKAAAAAARIRQIEEEKEREREAAALVASSQAVAEAEAPKESISEVPDQTPPRTPATLHKFTPTRPPKPMSSFSSSVSRTPSTEAEHRVSVLSEFEKVRHLPHGACILAANTRRALWVCCALSFSELHNNAICSWQQQGQQRLPQNSRSWMERGLSQTAMPHHWKLVQMISLPKCITQPLYVL